MIKKIRKRVCKYTSNKNGYSTLGGLILIFCFLLFIPVFTSITNLYSTWRNLNEIATVTIGMAKKNGGFNNEVMGLYSGLLTEYNIDESKLDIIFYPGEGVKTNKREALGIELRYRITFSIMQMDNSILKFDFVLPVKQNTFSQRYFRPSEL